jgi:hypothetical protein
LTALTAIQFRAGPGTIPHEAPLNSGLIPADSGLQLDLEIALSGVSAKVQPHGIFQSGRRCVETSDDVIERTFTRTRPKLSISNFTRGVL